MIDDGISGDDMTFGPCEDSIVNNIYLSFKLRRGKHLINKNIGSRLHTIQNTNDNSMKDARDFCREAVQWMFDSGRLKGFDVFCERDDNEVGRINIHVMAIAADNRQIPYSTFYKVGGV
jgi:phage gp46-like protein